MHHICYSVLKCMCNCSPMMIHLVTSAPPFGICKEIKTGKLQSNYSTVLEQISHSLNTHTFLLCVEKCNTGSVSTVISLDNINSLFSSLKTVITVCDKCKMHWLASLDEFHCLYGQMCMLLSPFFFKLQTILHAKFQLLLQFFCLDFLATVRVRWEEKSLWGALSLGSYAIRPLCLVV